ncbi:MAG: 50S ribosomal protein L9 [Candidatus Portnoybacteria bacterium]|nr:50S ribosomal protein L9 [Candidatus Portnoybacteria bacterium]
MKIILREDVENTGKKDEIKEVTDGYARNFLFPNKLAVLANKSELAKLEERKKIEEEKAEEELTVFQKVASELDGFELEILAKISEEDKLFGSITSTKISEKLKENGFKIEKDWIKLKTPIKEIGDHEVSIELPHNLEVKIKVIITEEVKK